MWVVDWSIYRAEILSPNCLRCHQIKVDVFLVSLSILLIFFPWRKTREIWWLKPIAFQTIRYCRDLPRIKICSRLFLEVNASRKFQSVWPFKFHFFSSIFFFADNWKQVALCSTKLLINHKYQYYCLNIEFIWK